MTEISRIDFSDATAVRDSAVQLFTEANDRRFFIDEDASSPQRAAIRRTARQWVARACHTLPAMPRAEAHTLLPLYDLIHRIAYGTPANKNQLNNSGRKLLQH